MYDSVTLYSMELCLYVQGTLISDVFLCHHRKKVLQIFTTATYMICILYRYETVWALGLLISVLYFNKENPSDTGRIAL